MGIVFEAQHVLLGKRLAVKVLGRRCSEARIRERFFHEARAASAIDHEHVVSVVDFGLVPRTRQPFLVMEHVAGESLEDWIRKEAPRPAAEAVEIVSQLLSALAVVHGAGLVHRDVKPANMLLVRGRRRWPFVKLLDFGIAGALDRTAWHRPQLTRANQVVGTPAYLAPEQARGGEVDPLWDLWAAAVVLYELLSGRLPFRLESIKQVSDDIANCRLISLRDVRPGLPAWLLGVMERAQSASPADRYPSAVAFLQALEQREVLQDEQDLRTTPFQRVDLFTPPPEIVTGKTKRPEDLRTSVVQSPEPRPTGPPKEVERARRSPAALPPADDWDQETLNRAPAEPLPRTTVASVAERAPRPPRPLVSSQPSAVRDLLDRVASGDSDEDLETRAVERVDLEELEAGLEERPTKPRRALSSRLAARVGDRPLLPLFALAGLLLLAAAIILLVAIL